VNAILPGWIPAGHESQEGDQESATWDTGVSDEDHMQHWSRRVGKVEDLAQTVEFMARCGFLNGQCLALDGGMSKKMIYVE
jgi:NAD(P)-dependent dehydrogenase (short-subunit alcohol dehydrogenase family)